MYNFHLHFSAEAIKRKVELDWGTEDSEYLQKVELHSEGALNEVRPDIIVYNAGTDILDGDPLGGLSISPHVQYIAMCKVYLEGVNQLCFMPPRQRQSWPEPLCF